jgi:hypothetical protein
MRDGSVHRSSEKPRGYRLDVGGVDVDLNISNV